MNKFAADELFHEECDDFLEWCEYFLAPLLPNGYQREWYYEEWNKIINNRDKHNVPNRKLLRWLLLLSRGHSKTMIWNEWLTIYDACKLNFPKQAMGSATNPQTQVFAKKIKEWLLKSPYLRYKFVPQRVAQMANDGLESARDASAGEEWNSQAVKLRNGAQIFFRSMKQEWSGLHVNKIILDDIVAKKQEKLKDKEGIRTFDFDIVPTAKSLKADVYVVGTPVRQNDVLQHIKNKGFFKVREYPAISDFNEFKSTVSKIFDSNGVMCQSFAERCKWLMNHQAFKFDEAKDLQKKAISMVLSRNRFGWKEYLRTYADVGKKAFVREYLLDHRSSASPVIGHEFLDAAKKAGESHQWLKRRYPFMERVALAWDFSFSKSDEADKTACVMFFYDRRFKKTGVQLLWEAQPKDYDAWKPYLMDKMKELATQYQADAVIPEANSILQLTEDIKSLNLPLKPIWTGNADISAKRKIKDGKSGNFDNMMSISKNAAIERTGTAFENGDLFFVYGDEKAKETSDQLAEELLSWEHDPSDRFKIIEAGAHPDSGFALVLGYQYFHNSKSQGVIGGFI